MERKVFLVVMAAGHGTRMGGDLPKQFLRLGGKAILQRTIERFVDALPGIRVITVLPEEYIPLWKEYCVTHNILLPQTLVAGGITRFHSVRNALAKVPDGVVVAIHDGVRPLLSEKLIRTMVARMDTERALIPVVPSVDTLKAVEKRRLPSGETVLQSIPGQEIDRSRVWCAQTPQLFRSEDIKAAYGQAYDTAFTDDASVAARNGIPLSYIEGERQNIKITTQEDLLLADAILRL